MRSYILIPYYSSTGCCEKLAMYIARGVELEGMEARIRRIPAIGRDDPVGALLVSKEDIIGCSGMIIGSPTRFGHMSAAVQSFWDKTGDVWYGGQLIGKPGAVFTSSSSMHGGQESTLLGMMMPLIHHGMIVVGIPYSEQAVCSTQKGGGPYGASSLESGPLSEDELAICHALGRRVAQIAKKLSD
jgi:NAD(P)H dehydrogenase (quinone)